MSAGSTRSPKAPAGFHLYVSVFQTCRMTLRAPARPLLLEHALDLGAGQRHRDEAVRERLHGEDLPVGDLAGQLAAADLVEHEIGADPARVHERHDGAAQGGRRRGLELRVGDVVAERRLARRRVRARDVGGDRADDAVRDRGGDDAVALDERRLVRVLRDVAGDDLVVDRRSDVGSPDFLSIVMSMSVTSRPNEAALVTGRPSIDAVVGVVRVTGDDEVDLVAHAVHDVHDRARDARALVVASPVGNPPSWMRTTIASAPFLRSFGTSAFTVSASSRKLDVRDAGRRDDLGRALERHADERDLRAVEVS